MSARALLRGARIVPLDGRRQEKRGDVLVENGGLLAIGGLREHVGVSLVVETKSPILPGFVQAFSWPEHHGLARGFLPDPHPASLLRDFARVSRELPEALYANSVRAALEQGALSGITAFMVPVSTTRWRTVEEAAAQLGLRVVLALDARASDLRAAVEAIQRGGGGARAALFLGSAEAASPRLLRASAALSEAADLPLVTLLGALGEAGGLARLERNGALTKRTVLVLGTGRALSAQEDVERLAGSSARLVLVPSYSLYTGLSLPPLERLLSRGVPLALGSMSASFRLGGDAFRELRLLSRILRDLTKTPASTALEIMSAGGAAALGLETGELSVGRRADFVSLDVLVDEEADHETLCRILLERGGRHAVRSVWVEGRVIAADGRMNTPAPGFDEARFRDWWGRRQRRSSEVLRRGWRQLWSRGGPGLGLISR